MPRHENRGGRRAPGTPRHTILVFCGAVSTEPAYFHGLRDRLRDNRVTAKIRKEGIAPDALVRAAAAYRDRRPGAFDVVWCVVDVDRFDIAGAVVEARRRGVSLAVSNPSFELWLLLHHAECRAHCAGYADVVRRLRKHVPAYDKASLDFSQFEAGVGDAIKRAKGLDPTGADHQRNPSTNVWRLVEMVVGLV